MILEKVFVECSRILHSLLFMGCLVHNHGFMENDLFIIMGSWESAVYNHVVMTKCSVHDHGFMVNALFIIMGSWEMLCS